MTSFVPLDVIGSVPETNSDALTDTAVPVFVPPVMYPVVLVTEGVTETEWFETEPFDAVGVPAVPLATDFDAALE